MMSLNKHVSQAETENGGSLERSPRWLVCPRCGGALHQEPQRLQCTACADNWPVVAGIPHFVQDFPYWGEIPLEKMREVNRQAQATSWNSGLTNSTDPEVRQAAEMILNLERANWQYLVDLGADSRALDLGAGTGTNSHALALRCREVVAVEPVLERVQFMQQRFIQEGLSNVRILRTSLWKLPFAAETFDLVAMNGVLEWVPLGCDGDPRQLQLKALRKAYELLRPGGHIYVGIENRFTPGYFIGYRDPHCGLPFVTVLPRPLAHWYARRKGQNGYRNYLYSSRGYRKLLNEAGFSHVEVYLALPSYNHPRFLIPQDGDLFSYYSRNFNSVRSGGLRQFVYEFLLKAGILQHFEYSFAIVARK